MVVEVVKLSRIEVVETVYDQGAYETGSGSGVSSLPPRIGERLLLLHVGSVEYLARNLTWMELHTDVIKS